MNNKDSQANRLLSDALFICFYFSVIQEFCSINNIEEITELESSGLIPVRGGRNAEECIRQIILAEERLNHNNLMNLNSKGVSEKENQETLYSIKYLESYNNCLRFYRREHLKRKETGENFDT